MTDSSDRAALIDAILPQTECRQCGFERCLDYARAMAEGAAPVNRCPVGGTRLARRLSALTGLPFAPLDPEYGSEAPFATASIRPDECIGCGRCIKACPSDAIIGAPKRMHTVIADACTGCSLCQASCPVDCIDMREAGRDWGADDAARARLRHEARRARIARERREEEERYAALGEDDATRKKKALAALLALGPGRR